MSEKQTIVIDAKDAILGRLASYAAKQSLLGKHVVIVNCGEALLTGRYRMVIEEYKHSRQRGGSSLKGPNFPKHSDRLVKRTVRGMLHYNHGRGKEAFKRIMCYNQVPKEFEHAKKITLVREIKTRTMSVKELSKEL